MNPQTSAASANHIYRNPGFLLLSWALLILALSIKPAGDLRINLFLSADKLIHAIFYSPLGFLAIATWQRRQAISGALFALALVTLLSGAFGFGIEIIQHYLPTRSFEIMDGVSDMLGACIGAALALRWTPALLRNEK